ncbi:PREDICTED: uncharacterized protein LOC106150201 [Chinchilla lanigera]|uniref:uncharacterized protein LOC106150201 n=1 Tax=Chinchilla lanigera TaxID=34839 RepID=UPI0006973266|nr:PREDICTED: uncharacterized protein LOC106150201 [Chinchilla lanigera]
MRRLRIRDYYRTTYRLTNLEPVPHELRSQTHAHAPDTYPETHPLPPVPCPHAHNVGALQAPGGDSSPLSFPAPSQTPKDSLVSLRTQKPSRQRGRWRAESLRLRTAGVRCAPRGLCQPRLRARRSQPTSAGPLLLLLWTTFPTSFSGSSQPFPGTFLRLDLKGRSPPSRQEPSSWHSTERKALSGSSGSKFNDLFMFLQKYECLINSVLKFIIFLYIKEKVSGSSLCDKIKF